MSHHTSSWHNHYGYQPLSCAQGCVSRFLAREMLTMSNIRLVISIAQKYDNLGVELADLIQVMAQALLMSS